MMVNVSSGKRGQMKIQQMAFMIIALALFFILVGLLVLSFSLSGLKESKERLDEENAMLLTLSISGYPEFSCGESFGTDKSFCIDADKFMAFKKVAEKDYDDFWGISSIEIRRLYNESSIVCDDSNFPNCGILRTTLSGGQGNDKTAFITLCRKAGFMGSPYDKCEVAKLIVRSEDVN